MASHVFCVSYFHQMLAFGEFRYTCAAYNSLTDKTVHSTTASVNVEGNTAIL